MIFPISGTMTEKPPLDSHPNPKLYLPDTTDVQASMSIASFPYTPSAEEGVMLQGFYWMSPDDGNWWTFLEDEMAMLAETGFDSIWIPPFVKTDSGDTARCGYEPYDYYDLGEYNQKGAVETRYGSRIELEQMIDTAHDYEIAILGDIVLNHNKGGALEYNPFTDSQTPTNFEAIASGQFPRNYSHFHPNAIEESDPGAWGTYPDLCHRHPYVRDEIVQWAKWLRDEIGFDGWRFDMIIGVTPEIYRHWMQNVSNTWAVGEYWDGSTEVNLNDQIEYLEDTNNTLTSFDFALMFELRKMIVNNGTYDMVGLENAGLLGIRPQQTVTFVTNHDTPHRPNSAIPVEYRNLAYSYILTHPGFPMVFWKDYYNPDLRRELQTLIEIHNTYARGTTEILYTDSDVYAMQRTGEPGLLYIINDNPTDTKTITLSTHWTDVRVSDLMGREETVYINEEGEGTFTIPAQNYVIYAINGKKIQDLPVFLQESRELLVKNTTAITIDGKFDETWGGPYARDNLGDAGFSTLDLTRMFLQVDRNNLYVGITYGENLPKEDIHIGVALDTVAGGSHYDPGLHENVSWGGLNTPDHLYYLGLNREYSNYTFETGVGYHYYQDAWHQTEDLERGVDFATHPLMQFLEIKIPLEKINLIAGGSFKIKIFSSPQDAIGAADSVPSDTEVDGKGESQSWLSLTEVFTIPPIPMETETTTTGKTPTIAAPSASWIIGWLGTVMIGILSIMKFREMEQTPF